MDILGPFFKHQPISMCWLGAELFPHLAPAACPGCSCSGAAQAPAWAHHKGLAEGATLSSHRLNPPLLSHASTACRACLRRRRIPKEGEGPYQLNLVAKLRAGLAHVHHGLKIARHVLAPPLIAPTQLHPYPGPVLRRDALKATARHVGGHWRDMTALVPLTQFSHITLIRTPAYASVCLGRQTRCHACKCLSAE